MSRMPDGDSGGMGQEQWTPPGGRILRGPGVKGAPLVLNAASRAAASGRPLIASQPPPGPLTPADQAERLRACEQAYQEGLQQGKTAERAAQAAQLEELRKAAVDRGLAEGRREGQERGRVEARRRVEEEAKARLEGLQAGLTRLEALVASLPGALERRLAEVEDDLIALSHAVVCRILGEQLVTREGVAACVREAIREVGKGPGNGMALQGLSLHMNGEDLAALKTDPALATWLEARAESGAVQWVADEKVEPGGCVVHAVGGGLDARLETQMAALRQALRQPRPPPAPVPGSATP